MKRYLVLAVSLLLVTVAGTTFAQQDGNGNGQDRNGNGTGQERDAAEDGQNRSGAEDGQSAAEEAARASGTAVANQMAAADDPALVAVGSLGASNLYFSYVVLGTVADGYAAGGYSAEMAQSLAEEAIALNRGSRDALRQLLRAGRVARVDREVVTDMIRAHELLIEQAEGLLSYVEDRSQTEQFQDYREQAWSMISQVLGLGEAQAGDDAGAQDGSPSGETSESGGQSESSNGAGSGGDEQSGSGAPSTGQSGSQSSRSDSG